MTVLVTGGAGYIGSNTVVQLLEAGSDVVLLDNLCNCSAKVFKRFDKITGKKPVFIQGYVCDRACLDLLFSKYLINAVINLAGLKAVG